MSVSQRPSWGLLFGSAAAIGVFGVLASGSFFGPDTSAFLPEHQGEWFRANTCDVLTITEKTATGKIWVLPADIQAQNFSTGLVDMMAGSDDLMKAFEQGASEAKADGGFGAVAAKGADGDFAAAPAAPMAADPRMEETRARFNKMIQNAETEANAQEEAIERKFDKLIEAAEAKWDEDTDNPALGKKVESLEEQYDAELNKASSLADARIERLQAQLERELEVIAAKSRPSAAAPMAIAAKPASPSGLVPMKDAPPPAGAAAPPPPRMPPPRYGGLADAATPPGLARAPFGQGALPSTAGLNELARNIAELAQKEKAAGQEVAALVAKAKEWQELAITLEMNEWEELLGPTSAIRAKSITANGQSCVGRIESDGDRFSFQLGSEAGQGEGLSVMARSSSLFGRSQPNVERDPS